MIPKGTYDKALYDKIGKFYNLYNTYNAIAKFKGSDKEFIIKSIKTADPRVVFCSDAQTGLGTFAKLIDKITFLNRKPIDFFTRKDYQEMLKESYTPEQIKDILWNTFKETAAQILFKGENNNKLVFEVLPEGDITVEQANVIIQELEGSGFFDCSFDGHKFFIIYKGPLHNNIQQPTLASLPELERRNQISSMTDQMSPMMIEKTQKVIDNLMLEAEMIAQLEKLTGKKVVLENLHGTPVKPMNLKPGEIYVWTGGAELLDVKYLGRTDELARTNADIKPSSSVGKGYIFQWMFDGRYFELGPHTIMQDIIQKESDEISEVVETGPGEYTQEQMDQFIKALVSKISWGDKNYGGGPNIAIPSSWPASTVVYTRDSILQTWEEAKARYSNAKWYVWKADIGGSLNKPKQLASQRLDINSILAIVSKHPEAFRSMSIGVDNEDTETLSKVVDTKGD